MKAISKIALMTSGVLSLGLLTACQTTTAPQQNAQSAEQFKKPRPDRISPELRAERKQMHEDRKQISQQIRQACDGKSVGQAVQIKTTKQNIDGSCYIRFVADRKDAKNLKDEARGKQKPQDRRADAKETRDLEAKHDLKTKGDFQAQRFDRQTQLTDAKRAELVKQYDMRLAQRQALQQAKTAACQGQQDGKVVQIKSGEHIINGQCKVFFKPDAQSMTKPV